MPTTTPTWVFDGSPIADPFGHGERAVRFLRALKHPKSRAPGRAFALDRWQERIVRRVYGPRHDDGSRIVKTVVLLLPRGNRKTSIAAALALLHAIGPERVPGGEVISAAADRKQARLAYAEAVGIIRSHKATLGATRIVDSRNRLTHVRDGSFLESISADAGTQHGRTPVFVLADELHAWPKRDLWDVLRSGLPKTPGSLLVVATTAGRGQDNVAHDIVDYARKVARGEIEDPATLPILFEADANADWRDEALWRSVNPGLSCSPPYPDIEGLRQLAREAESRPGDREAFRQLHLNVWLDHSADPFVEMAVYDAGAQPIDLDAFERDRAPCWLGVDLSSNGDLTAVVAAFRDGEEGYAVVPWFFCPRDNLRGRADRDGVPYPTWAEAGLIEATPGNVVDFRTVEARIRDLCDRFDVREIAFDPHMGRNMMANLIDDGLPAIEMRQGWVTMAPAVKELERAIIGRRFRHGGHPVLRWNFSNIAVHTDTPGNKSFHKGKSRDRIDGAQAAAMAVGRAFMNQETRSIYADADARPDGFLVW
ncbi:terminase large subunit [Chelatococcus sambhunathii]|uniref:Terminase large subunit n=1 Tax=Chelatococcus sambhunathii TaxID=363953 RepID=A0ABU1DEL7_9HYPH|nr:terminase TerL endonuclease subunit [Chelatococcus sambhunathii]MDR4306563.1 terminase large subunit [Chelatococcus sambhunathii]